MGREGGEKEKEYRKQEGLKTRGDGEGEAGREEGRGNKMEG